MATRFSASDARQKSDEAKEKLKQKRKLDREKKIELAKKKSSINEGFESQRMKLITAAINAQTEIKCDSIFLYKNLLDLGFEVIESGDVKKQSRPVRVYGGYGFSKKVFEDAKSEIFSALDKFIDKSNKSTKRYYGSRVRLHGAHYAALYDALNSQWPWSDFYGDEIFSEVVPISISSKFYSDIELINEKLNSYRKLLEGNEIKIDVDALEDECDYEVENKDQTISKEELIEGEYYFGESDDDCEVLKPSSDRNTLKIKWGGKSSFIFLNESIFSSKGLAWLTDKNGQGLMDGIFKELERAAENGKTSLRLDFSLTKDGWFFEGDIFKLHSCIPYDLVGIIENHKFTIQDTLSKSKTYTIKVSW